MLKLFFLIVIFGFFRTFKNKNKYLLWCSVALFLALTLRHEVCFVDTVRYVYDYLSIGNYSIEQVYANAEKDPGFFVTSKLISMMVGTNYTLWFGVHAILFVIPLYLLIKKYSTNITVSFVVFCALGFAFFSMTGMRQNDAMGLTMLALYYLLEDKKKYFVILVLLASFFHKTSAIFLIVYFFDWLPLNKKSIALYVILSAAAIASTKLFLQQLAVFQVDERFEYYLQNQSSINFSGLAQQVLLLGASLYLFGEQYKERLYKILICMAFVGVVFQGMSFAIAEMFRMSMYFSIANIILFANALELYSRRVGNRTVLNWAVIIISLYFVTSKNNGFLCDYYFFFQDVPAEVYNELFI